MIKIFGRNYISAKEAAARYGYSQSWFQKRRLNKKKPVYLRLEGTSKVYYDLDCTDDWFREQIEINTYGNG